MIPRLGKYIDWILARLFFNLMDLMLDCSTRRELCGRLGEIYQMVSKTTPPSYHLEHINILFKLGF